MVKFDYCAITICVYTYIIVYYENQSNTLLYRLSMLNKVSVFAYIHISLCLVVLKTAEFMSEFSRRIYMTTCYAKPSEEKHSRRNEIRKFLPNEVAYFEKKPIEMLNLQRNWRKHTTGKSKERKQEKLRRLKISSHLSFKKLSLAYCAVIYGLRWKFIQIYTDSTSSSNFSHFSAAVAHLFKGRPRVCRRRQSVKKGHL